MTTVRNRSHLLSSSHVFRAMGTTIGITIVHDARQEDAAKEALVCAERFFRDNEKRFSRFDSSSELSLLNRRGWLDRPSDEFLDVLERASRWQKSTSGVFNPAVLPALLSAGYDVDFDIVKKRSTALKVEPSPQITVGQAFSVSRSGSGQTTIELNDDAKIDPGGIVKGWTVDRAGERLRKFHGYLVDAGGDIAVRGSNPSGSPWVVGVANPDNAGVMIDIVALESGGLATSSVRKRSWISGAPGISDAGRAHHIIDPAQGLPSDSNVIQATVVAGSAEEADVLAKSVIVLGADRGINKVESITGAQALLVLKSGALMQTSNWAQLQPVQSIGAALWPDRSELRGLQ